MWPEILKAGAQVLGGLIGYKGTSNTNAANAKQVADTNAFNAAEAQKNRDFQEHMSDTQYQRATADMLAAGLNPALAYQQGGAGTPGGSTASGTAARFDNPSAPLATATANVVNSALEAAQQVANIEQTRVTTQQIAQDVGLKTYTNPFIMRRTQAEAESAESKSRVDVGSIDALIEAAKKANILTSASARNYNASAQLQELAAPEARNSANIQNSWFSKYVAPYLDTATKTSKLVGAFIK